MAQQIEPGAVDKDQVLGDIALVELVVVEGYPGEGAFRDPDALLQSVKRILRALAGQPGMLAAYKLTLMDAVEAIEKAERPR